MSVTTRPSSFRLRASEASQARASFSLGENFLPRLPSAQFQGELRSILKNSRDEPRAAELLNLGCRLQDRDPSAALEFFIQLAGSGKIPEEIRSQARRQAERLQEKGNFGNRAERLLKRIREDATDWKLILPMMGARVLAEIGGAWSLAHLAGKQSGFWTRGSGARWAAGALGYGIEGASIVGIGRALSPSSGGGIGEDLAKSYLAVGTLRLFGAAGGGYASKWLGLAAVHRLESTFGIRPETDLGTLLAESLGSLVSLEVGSHLGSRFLGNRLTSFPRELKIRARAPEASSREGLFNSHPFHPRLAEALAIRYQDRLANIHGQAPKPITKLEGISWMAGGDDESWQGKPRLVNLPDTAMGQLFTGGKPSRAIPLIANSSEQLAQKIPLAFFRRPTGQNPRTIILELRPGSAQEINADYLNRLTEKLGNDLPDRTPFEVIDAAGRRTYLGKVSNHRLRWQDFQDPAWSHAKLQSSGTEFEVESAMGLYLVLAHLRKHSHHSSQTSFVARLIGAKPDVFETSLSNFIQRALNFFQVPGKSFRLDLRESELPLDFHLTDTIWLAADRVSELPAPPQPAAVSSLPPLAEAIAGHSPIVSSHARVPANDPPLLLITSAQSLREIPTRFFLNKAPRRIEVWYELPASASAEREHWRAIFKDIPSGTVLTIHESRKKRTHTVQRRGDNVHLRSAEWKPVIGWNPGIPISVFDVPHLLRQLQFLQQIDSSDHLAASIREPWSAKEIGLFLDLINSWGNLPYRDIEIRSSHEPELSVRLRKNHMGQYVAEDLKPLRGPRK